MSTSIHLYPAELLSELCRAVFVAALPSYPSTLDPPLVLSTDFRPPTGLPSACPPGIWPESLARSTLVSLCLVNRAFYNAAKPWLWSKIEVRLPHNWLAFVDALSGLPEERDDVEGAIVQVIELVAATTITNPSLSSLKMDDPESQKTAEELRDTVIAHLSEVVPPDGSIPPELLSPPASREPSPRRFQARTLSPGRWRLMRAISAAVQQAISGSSLDVYVPTPDDPRPGRHIQHLDFNHFRTIGMRRSVEEGVSNRFVTAARMYRILQEMPNLLAFGATEYMDGALNTDVLTELLFRGQRSQPSETARFLAVTTEDAEEWSRRSECMALEAVDFCGCVSAVFVAALKEVVERYLATDTDEREARRGRHYKDPVERILFPRLRRLGFRGAKSIEASVLESFVLSCPFLSYLDLSGTRCTPDLLHNIGASSTVQLRALSLGRCPSLTGSSLVWFLTRGKASFGLTQVSLYGDTTFPSPLSEEELLSIVCEAPCFTSGKLEYLDLSSSPVTGAVLKSFCKQPALRSLGLSYVPELSLKEVAAFIANACVNLEIITLISTSPELLGPSRFVSLALHQHIVTPLARAPFTFSLSGSATSGSAPTRLRVIELSNPSLNGLGAGSEGWRIVRSKGGRGWYVDSTAGWCADDEEGTVFRRDLPKVHPIRKEVDRLSDACGNVGSGVGWHARKMELLHGEGLLGREDGLYGAVSFAYSS